MTRALKEDAYDPDGARKLLDEAGVKDLKLKVWAMPVARAYDPDRQGQREMIKADFAKIGVDADRVNPLDDFLRRSSAKDHDGAVLLGWTRRQWRPGQFSGALAELRSGRRQEPGRMVQPALRGPHRKAKVTTDPAERARPLQEAQAIFKEEAPWATLAHSLDTVAMSKQVKNYRIDAFGAHRFDKVDLADSGGKRCTHFPLAFGAALGSTYSKLSRRRLSQGRHRTRRAGGSAGGLSL